MPPGGSPVQYAASYSYDATNRPTGVSWTPAPTPGAPTASRVTFAHSYNAVNQRIGQSISDNSWVNYPAATASTVSYMANALNQYTAVGPVSPSYDSNGNLTSDGTFTFGYDAENRLTSASGAGNTVAYAFDAQGRRKTRTVSGTTTVFVTDADNREVLEYDGVSGAIQRWYAYNLGLNDAVNQTNVTVGTRAALVPDIQGSIIASLDSGSGSLSKLGYLPYGKSTSAGPYGFTGQRVDVEMGGLYYYRARHYSPGWGRLLQVDPIGYNGGINLYRYVSNDPLNLVDPLGRAPTTQADTFIPALGAGDVLAGAAAAGASSTIIITAGAAAAACILLCSAQTGPEPSILPSEQATPLPDDLVGVQDELSGARGNRNNSGPLAPENGGTGNAQADFDKLTGGQNRPVPPESSYPPGTLIGDNGITLRPGTGSAAPRIDIPANGAKPHETLHY